MFKLRNPFSSPKEVEYTPPALRRQHALILAAVVSAVVSIPLGYFAFQVTKPKQIKVLDITITATPTPEPVITETPSPVPTVVKGSPTPTKAAEPTAAPVTKTFPKTALGFPNNKVGIHIYADPRDVELASELVNTNGGDWGWVTLNYDIKDRSSEKWNNIFAKMKEYHIIPIVQLFNHSKIPSNAETEGAADFLAGLNWPIKHRFISVYNEVNADEYWDWKLDPAGYAHVLNHTIDSFKARNGNFFMMNGAFNASARNDRVKTDLGVLTAYMTEDEYLVKMNQAVPGIFKKLDGWASHCYPHPYYSGKPLDWKMPNETAWEAGRDTMSSYKWELKVLQEKLGITGLPVFITEAGWPHAEGGPPKGPWHDQNTVGAFYRDMYEKLYFQDSRVVAVTPFILKITPLANFSWMKEDGTKYPQWDDVVRIPKVKGEPPVN